MLPELYTRTLVDQRRALVGWTIGAALAGTFYAGFYPQLADGQMADAVAGYPEALREAFRLEDITSAAGYLGSSVFGLILPLLAMLYGITTGARAVAGDEESGYLDLLLAHPISRAQLVLQRFAALATGAILLTTGICLAMLAIRGPAQLTDVAVGAFVAQCLNLALLATTFGALSLAIGAATGRRTVVLAATAIVGVLTYGLHAFAGALGAEGARYLSPFHYYIGGDPLRNGPQWTDAAVLLLGTLVLAGTAVVGLRRRDLNT